MATLLAVAIFINYVDRGNLATAAPVIKQQLHLSATQIGVLLSAFYWTYAFSQPGAGWLANMAGILGPAITGLMIDRSGHFYTAFGLAIAVSLAGVMSWVAIVPKIAPVTWVPRSLIPRAAVAAER